MFERSAFRFMLGRLAAFRTAAVPTAGILAGAFIAGTAVLAGCSGGGGTQSTIPLAGSAGGQRLAQSVTTFGVVDANSVWHYQSPVSVPWPKGAPATGDVLVACAEGQWNALPQTPAGWTKLYSANSGFGTALFYKIAGASEPASVSFAIPVPYNISAAMVRITGAATTAPLWSHVTGSGTTIATAGVVPNVLGMLPVACFGGVNAGAFSVAAGWTLGARDTSSFATAIESRATVTTDTTTAVSVSATATTTAASSDAYGVLVAPAAGTPTPTAPPTTPPAGTLAVRDANSVDHYQSPATVPWPHGAPASGDVLIACVESQWQAAPQPPAGWTTLSTSNTRFGSALFYKIAGASEPASVAFAIPVPYNVSASMVRIAGAAPAAPQWSHAENSGGAGAIATPSLVPNALGMLPLACFGGVNAASFAIAGGWTSTTHDTGGYVTTIETRSTVTTDTATAISVSSVPAAASSGNDAYGILVAPVGGATPPPGGIGLSPSSLAFTSTTAAAQSVSATQTGNTAFTASTQNCGGIATIVSSGAGRFSVTPQGVGSCSFTIAGANAKTATLAVTTTSTVITVR